MAVEQSNKVRATPELEVKTESIKQRVRLIALCEIDGIVCMLAQQRSSGWCELLGGAVEPGETYIDAI